MVAPKSLLASLMLWQACFAAPAGDTARAQSIEWRPYEPREITHGSWRIKSLLDDAGLSGRFVFFVDFDRHGNAWIASSEGLYSYDGYTWTRYSQRDGLPSNFVRSVRVAGDGTLWIGTNKGVATRDAQGRITVLKDAGPAGPNVRRIVEDPDGTLWFCSDTWLTPNASSGLASYRRGEWTVYRQEDGLPGNYVSDYSRDSAGRRFVLSSNGLAVNDGSGWNRPLEAGGFAGYDHCFWSITESPLYGVLATTKNALYSLKNGKWSRIEHDRPELRRLKLTTTSSGEVITLCAHYDAPKYFLGWNGSDFVRLSEPVHVPGEATYVTVAPDGSIWCVGYDLLLRWERSGGEWAEFSDISAPQTVDRQGRVWFTADGQTLRLNCDDTWESVPCAVSEILPGRDGEVLGFSRQTVYRFTRHEVISYGAEQTGVHCITGLTLGARGLLWLHGSDRSERNVVSIFDGTSWLARASSEIQGGRWCDAAADPAGGVYYLISEESNENPRLIHADRDGIDPVQLPGDARGYSSRLHVDYRGCLWLYGHFGLFMLVDGSWRPVEDISSTRVSGTVNAGGETWFAYDGTAGGGVGLGRFRNGSWSYFSLDNRPFVCGRESGGAVFFATRHTLHRVTTGASEASSPVTLPVDRKIYRAVQGPTGDVWIDVGDVVLRYRPDRVPPQTLILNAAREVREGDPLDVTFRGIERFKPHGEGALTYSWRIGSGAWTDFGPAPTEALQISLRPGRYALEVRARDQGLDVDPTPARAEFCIAAIPWPQRPWFWPVAGAAFVGLALLGAVAVIARNRARFQAIRLERIVSERTAELRESEARFRAMAAAAPIPIVISRESDGVILYANSLLGETLGIPSDELPGRRSEEFFGSPSVRRKMLAEVRKAGHVQARELLAKKADGASIWCLVSLQKMLYGGQPAVIAGFHDITERKRSAEELERAREAAEAASRAKSVFLANLSHEIRTPLMAMLGSAEASARSGETVGGKIGFAEIISRNGRHLLSLFDNLLDVARLGAGKFAVRPVRCSLPEILADVRSVAHLPHRKPGVDFRLICEGPIPSEITTDPLRLKQAIINLVNNALKFTDAGHVHVRVKMHVENDNRPELSVEVEDTGPGIPQPERERIFSAFEQVEMRSGRHPVGVGLGLALARSIATGLGGTLVLESREGCGSTFKLRVPAGPLEAAEWVTPAETGVLPMTSATEPTPMTLQPETRHEIQGSVLVAEDSPDARALIAHALIEAGANVTVVENGEEAVEAAGKQVYDLVLMDIRMPVMDGIAATARLRRSRYLAPIIAMTASVTREDQQRIIAEGFDDLWPKPISLRQIVERASAYLRAPVIDGQKASQSRKKTAPPRSDSRYTMLVTEFARNLPERLHAIQVAVDKHDLQTAREILHQLAGTGGMMGFMRLSDEAGRVLSRIRSGICTGAGDELRVLERLIAEASDSALKSAAPNAGAPRPKA